MMDILMKRNKSMFTFINAVFNFKSVFVFFNTDILLMLLLSTCSEKNRRKLARV